MSSSERPRSLLVLLVISGAAALAVEVVLARLLHRVLGSTSLAVAGVLAGFLGGMGAGAFVAERRLGAIRRPLVAYAACELLALVAAGSFVFTEDLWSGLLRLPAGDAIVIALVGLLAAPLGATFPLVVAALGGDEVTERRVRLAYGLNALGGAAGGLAAGILGVPALGELGTLAIAWTAQALVAATVVALARRGESASASLSTSNPVTAPGASPPLPSSAVHAALVGLTGFSTLYWEVLWTRILVLTVGATVYSFAVIACGVLVGIGLGSLLVPRSLSSRAAALLPVAVAGLLVAGYFAVPHLATAYVLAARASSGAPLVPGVLGAGAIVLVPSALLGSIFPVVVARRPGRAGLLFAASSCGSIAGALAAGPLGAGRISLEAAYALGTAALVATAVPALAVGAVEASRAMRLVCGSLVVAAGLGAAALATAAPSWDPGRLLAGVYQWSREDLLERTVAESCAARELLCVVPGREVIVTVERVAESNTVYVRGNGKTEGSVPADPAQPSLADLPTQILLGALPAELVATDPARSALLIGLGSGVTLGALLEGAGRSFAPGQVEVIEIEPAFLAAIRHPRARPLLEPFVPAAVLDGGDAGPVFRFGDARRILGAGLAGRRFTAIVSQPSEPWNPGAAPLFTIELFTEAARRLEEGGIFCQWLQAYKLDLEALRLLVRTFRRVFPHVLVLRPPATGELILIGGAAPIPLERLLDAPPGRLLAFAGLEVPADRLAVILAGGSALDDWVGLGLHLPVSTDRRGGLEYLGALGLHAESDVARRNLQALRRLGDAGTVLRDLPERLRRDAGFRRLLAARNVRLGDAAEARALVEGDSSEEAARLRTAAAACEADEVKP